MALEKAIEELREEVKRQGQVSRALAMNAGNAKQRADEAKKREDYEKESKEQFKSIAFTLKSQLSMAKKEQGSDKLDKLEAQRDKQAKKDEAKEEGREVDFKKVKEPSFIAKLSKLAFGILGAAAFALVVKNFDKIKQFFVEKLVPATQKLLVFMRDVAFPFIVNNFDSILKGIVGIAAFVVGTKVLIKIYNATVAMTTGFATMAAGVTKVVKFLRIDKALKALGLAARFLRIFMLQTFIPTVVSTFTSVMKSLGGNLLKALKFLQVKAIAFKGFMLATALPAIGATLMGLVTAFGAILAPLAVPIAIAAMIGLAIAAIGVALVQLRNRLGFDSVFDVLMLGVANLQDGFAHLVNFFGALVDKVFGVVEKFGKFLGFEIDLPDVPKMATDNAARFKDLAQEKAANKQGLRKSGGLRQQMAEERKAEIRARENARLAELEKKFGLDKVEAEPDVVITRKEYNEGRLNDAQRAALESGMTLGEVLTQMQDDQAAISSARPNAQAAATTNVNAPTNVNSNQNFYGDPAPATDDTDKVPA